MLVIVLYCVAVASLQTSLHLTSRDLAMAEPEHDEELCENVLLLLEPEGFEPLISLSIAARAARVCSFSSNTLAFFMGRGELDAEED